MFNVSDCNNSVESWSSLKMMFWNVCGWSCGQVDVVKEVESMDMRCRVFNRFKPDIICVAETWLKVEDVASFDGYTWFGQNRRSISRRAVRGSGGVGVFFCNAILNNWTVSVLDSETEDILWLKVDCRGGHSSIVLAVCYLPPMNSCRDVDVYGVLSVLAEQVARYSQLGTVVLCGDFNARCGYLQEGTIPRTTIDGTKNEQGEALVEFLKDADLCLVN